MKILRFDAGLAERIGWRPDDVKLTSSIAVAEGAGEAHAYVLYFEPGGEIGAHEAGFGQLFFAVSGTAGWPVVTASVSTSRKGRPPSSIAARSIRRAARPD